LDEHRGRKGSREGSYTIQARKSFRRTLNLCFKEKRLGGRGKAGALKDTTGLAKLMKKGGGGGLRKGVQEGKEISINAYSVRKEKKSKVRNCTAVGKVEEAELRREKSLGLRGGMIKKREQFTKRGIGGGGKQGRNEDFHHFT